jgi:hypothetical protein
MATQRYISTSFWTDKWVRSIDPSERYLYMYLLTNPQTNIAGVYDITYDRIAFDTGYDERTLRPMFARFAKAGKVYFLDEEWIVIPSWPKHQRITERDNNRKGIDRILWAIPVVIFAQLEDVGYQYQYLRDIVRPFEGAYKTLVRASNYSDTDTDTDTDSDTVVVRATATQVAPTPADYPQVIHKEPKTQRDKRIPSLTLGECSNVRLTADELQRLNDEHGESVVREAIDFLSMWKEEKGRRIKNDNYALRRWAISAVHERRTRPGAQQTTRPEVLAEIRRVMGS